jgi:3-methyladenine DNA glycosylase AlkD
VAEQTPAAQGLGRALVELIDDPESFLAVLREGFTGLADPVYAAEQERVAPGSGATIGVRWPLVKAVAAQLRAPLAESSSASALWLAERLATAAEHELRLFSHVPLRRALADDPERSWQLLRRLARAAGDWIAVDSLAHLYAQGILAERFRWAELEQLVYSQQRWERRLVGSTVATIPFRLPRHRRAELAATPGLMLIKSLLGDAEADVQRALSWALRSWYGVDTRAVEGLLLDEAMAARKGDDGHRAWVLRDALSLPAMDRRVAADVREELAGIRRRADAPSTSTAAAAAAAFRDLDELTERALAEQGDRQRLSAGGRASDRANEPETTQHAGFARSGAAGDRGANASDRRDAAATTQHAGFARSGAAGDRGANASDRRDAAATTQHAGFARSGAAGDRGANR